MAETSDQHMGSTLARGGRLLTLYALRGVTDGLMVHQGTEGRKGREEKKGNGKPRNTRKVGGGWSLWNRLCCQIAFTVQDKEASSVFVPFVVGPLAV